jgi:hypothetical protein
MSQNETNAPQKEPAPALQLENAMNENARKDSPETRTRLFQELLFSDLLLALVDGPLPEVENNGKPQNINVAIMTNPQGVQFAAVFTRAAAAKKWRLEGGQYVSIKGQDIFKLLEPSPAEIIALNPGSNPFLTLTKAEYRSLAQGVVPQVAKSPVQSMGENNPENGMQISFPPDAFSDDQKAAVQQHLNNYPDIEAAALGALLPPNAPDQNAWLRTIFLRTQKLDSNQENVQKFCLDLRDNLVKNSPHFNNIALEVGVMPDDQFWVAVNENNFQLFDKNPPKNSGTKPQEQPRRPVMPPPGGRKA